MFFTFMVGITFMIFITFMGITLTSDADKPGNNASHKYVNH